MSHSKNAPPMMPLHPLPPPGPGAPPYDTQSQDAYATPPWAPTSPVSRCPCTPAPFNALPHDANSAHPHSAPPNADPQQHCFHLDASLSVCLCVYLGDRAHTYRLASWPKWFSLSHALVDMASVWCGCHQRAAVSLSFESAVKLQLLVGSLVFAVLSNFGALH